jgi:Tol biopolymer transport system component
VTIELPFFAAPGYTPFVLPGGGELIVAEAFGQGHDPAVYRVNVATRGAEKLFSVPAGPFYRPDFAISPDGRTLLYVTSEVLPPRLFTMDLSAARSAAPR